MPNDELQSSHYFSLTFLLISWWNSAFCLKDFGVYGQFPYFQYESTSFILKCQIHEPRLARLSPQQYQQKQGLNTKETSPVYSSNNCLVLALFNSVRFQFLFENGLPTIANSLQFAANSLLIIANIPSQTVCVSLRRFTSIWEIGLHTSKFNLVIT